MPLDGYPCEDGSQKCGEPYTRTRVLELSANLSRSLDRDPLCASVFLCPIGASEHLPIGAGDVDLEADDRVGRDFKLQQSVSKKVGAPENDPLFLDETEFDIGERI